MSKKIIVSFLGVALFLGGSFSVSAQTTPSAQIQALLDQIKALQAQIETLRIAQQQVVTAAGQVRDTLKLIRSLRQGVSGEDVEALQVILAADSSIYPEGLITGFYGPLTVKAVRQFQKKFGIEQLGIVGPKTLAQLNKEIEKLTLRHSDDDDDDEDNDNRGRGNKKSKFCVIIPPGHLIAPGWLILNKNKLIEIPICQNLPPGIAKKLGTTTPPVTDITAPVVSGISASNITSSSARISWYTDESATSRVWYSTTTPVATSSAPSVGSSARVKSHNVTITGLSANTTYYYRVGSTDASGNTIVSGEFTFTTGLVADTSAPVITGLTTTSTTANGSHVVWNTNEDATSKVWYGTSSPLIIGGDTPMVSSSALVTSHDLVLSGLASSTAYYFIAVSSDAVGNTASSSQLSFTTLSQ